MKICPACKKEYEDGMKFCPVDGTALIEASESEKSPPSGVTTGKILSGGDVNISSTTNQSITNIQEDDSKKIMTCVVSGRQDVVTEGAICGTCAQWAHKRHFNAKNGECEKCQKEKLENSRSEYRNLFEECIADDDKIDADERRVLEEKASGLGLTPDEVEQIESKVRVKFQSRLFALRSPEEKIRIKKAKTLLLKICDFKNAYEKFKKLSTSLRKDKEVTGLYVMSAIAYKPEEALSILDQNLIYRTDTPRKSFLRICALEALGEDSEASEELKKSLHIFPDDPYLKAKTLERLTDLYLSDEQEDDQLDDMREYSEEINLPENSSDSYISFVSRYYRMAYDDAYTVIDMLDSVEELYYAKIKPIVKDLEKSYWESEKDRIEVESATESVEFENPIGEESEEIPTASDTEDTPDDYDTEPVSSDDVSEDEEIAEEETTSVYEEESGVNGSYLEEESEVAVNEETHADEDEQTATDDYSSYNKKTAILVAAVVGCFLIFFNWENGKFTGNSSKAENNKKSSIKTPPLGEKFTVPSILMEMIWCPPGTFTMGSPISENGRIDDEFQHQVTLTNGFHLGKYEVTQTQWERVMGNNPSFFKGSNRPVEYVSWKDAVDFCRKLNAIEKKAGRLAPGKSYQLPTEAQWEYACRAGTTTAYSWGNYLNHIGANYNWTENDNRRGETRNVGNYAANPWGFFDMHGNVLEWTADWYHYPSGNPVFDPSGPASGSNRVIRGGSWASGGTSLRSAKRLNQPPGKRFRDLGFRVGFYKSL